jgi:hypothetical protein
MGSECEITKYQSVFGKYQALGGSGVLLGLVGIIRRIQEVGDDPTSRVDVYLDVKYHSPVYYLKFTLICVLIFPRKV